MPTALCPGIIFRAGDTACKVGPLKARKILQLGRQCRLIKLTVWRMSQHGIEHAMVANAGCDGARIDPANADNLLRRQPVAQMVLRAEV